MSLLNKLPTLAQERAKSNATPKHQMEPRRADSDKARKADERELKKWRKAITLRDGMVCRWCKCDVIATLERVPKQAQTHHATPREHRPTRYDVRNGIRLCGTCHDRVTGTVGEKAIVIASKTFSLDGREYPDMTSGVRFRKVV
jgi:hypothetical protein